MGCAGSKSAPAPGDVTLPNAAPSASPALPTVPPPSVPRPFDAALAAGDATAVEAALRGSSAPGRPAALVQCADALGRRPLHAAAAAGHADVCRVLIQVGCADVNDADLLGDTPLLLAVVGGEWRGRGRRCVGRKGMASVHKPTRPRFAAGNRSVA